MGLAASFEAPSDCPFYLRHAATLLPAQQNSSKTDRICVFLLISESFAVFSAAVTATRLNLAGWHESC
ncbi:MAG: hypothetical protein A3I66_22395 [Burkholderiales bacterium RIFCSPLOWO2_02_FULL_57_36]|nr:MAG: hypothetical protein A3I66_22395 [Burkholderiales bacterium RIFCSPLOWO2_02_FULL_57_36]